MKNIFLIFIAIIILTSCGFSNMSRENNWSGDMKKGISETKYGEFTITELFTFKGITIYRFIDAGHTRYFAINKETKDVVSIISTTAESSGKTTIVEDDTLIVPR